MEQAPKIFDPKIVLCIAAHADDIDFTAGGTVATWAHKGTIIYYLILTDGCRGIHDQHISSEKLAETRQSEQLAAAKVLGVKKVFFLHYSDDCLENTPDLKRDLVRFIRHLKPDVAVTLDPSVLYVAELGLINHPDHRAAGQAVLDAIYPLAQDHLSFPDLLREGYKPHKVATIMLVNWLEHNYTIDITDIFERKLQAIHTHKSQKLDAHMAKELAEQADKLHNCAYAETFMRIDAA